VIVLAATGAIVGDNIGYLIGRKGGRWISSARTLQRQRSESCAPASRSSNGTAPRPCTSGAHTRLRVWASWLAGATRMHWRSFVLWNALGDLLGGRDRPDRLLLGNSAGNAIETFGIYGLVAALLAVASALFMHRRTRRRRSSSGDVQEPSPPTPASAGRQSGSRRTERGGLRL